VKQRKVVVEIRDEETGEVLQRSTGLLRDYEWRCDPVQTGVTETGWKTFAPGPQYVISAVLDRVVA
jgi:hypothetical protein